MALMCVLHLSAQSDYKASVFGCVSDGITNNTQSIQTAINTISSRGGGTLHFYVGRYLTGTVFLKDNVTLALHEGATLVGVPFIYDYAGPSGAPKGLIVAEGQTNVGVVGMLAERDNRTDVVGKGILQGQGSQVRKNAEVQVARGYLQETLAQAAPALISFSGCTGVKVTGLLLEQSAADVVTCHNCQSVEIRGLLIDSRETPGSDGIVLNGCKGATVADSFIHVSGKAIQTARSNGVKLRHNKTPKGKL